MPVIPVGAQIFDVVFHPTFATVYTGLLTGHVKAFAYDEQGGHKQTFSIRPSKRSCRGLTIDHDGSHLYSVGKSKALNIIDTTTESIEIRAKAHDSPINRVKHLMPWLLSTGDDDGVVKLWDPRQKDSVRTYTQHFDFITDFLWLEDKKHLVASSGDGTLSVMDVRSKKPEPVAQSEDQEDELLSLVAIKGYIFSGSKVVVGTQLGILSIFNRSSGWGDCVDRIPGHPLSVDALCNIPSSIPDVDAMSIVLTGSSDGYVRAVEILPTKLLGVVADHGEWPVERIAVGSGVGQLTIEDNASKKGNRVANTRNEDYDANKEEKASHQRKWWVGSVGHEDVLRMSDLEGFFRDGDQDEGDKQQGSLGVDGQRDDSEDVENVSGEEMLVAQVEEIPAVKEADSDSDSDTPHAKKRKRKPEKEPVVLKKKGKKAVEIDKTFFDDL
ncbi:WD40-repeat-containing domain protein [Cyathus striatus]|nr:WD40-repeat-containing domain protein [Cyathus striatus]